MSQTPMLRQYFGIKSEYPDCIVFFRLGDFYEMFADDAKLASRLLDITLTGRDAGEKERIPMCGVPYHAADSYIAKLVSLGHKVAVCEQVEDPKQAKGVVRREVVRVVTPGTVLDDDLLNSDLNNYLVSIAGSDTTLGLAAVDISTGEFTVCEFRGPNRVSDMIRELSRLEPAECLAPSAQGDYITGLLKGFRTSLSLYDDRAFYRETAYRRLTDHFETSTLAGFGCEGMIQAIRAAGAILHYLDDTQKRLITHITSLRVYDPSGHMILDPTTCRNLELLQSMRGNDKQGSLLGVLDKTRTAMGARLLRHWISQPLCNIDRITERQAAVHEFVNDLGFLDSVTECLDKIHDLERLTGRISYGSASPRDLIALKSSLGVLPGLRNLLTGKTGMLGTLFADMDPLEDIYRRIDRTLINDPPISPREGNIVASGFDPEIDRLRTARKEGTTWIAKLEEAERAQTGIKSLKVGFNKVFGYYLEVTRPNLHLVPNHYIRKQTLSNAERYITPELKEKEELILGAEEKLNDLEYAVFCELRSWIAGEASRIQKTAAAIATIDVLSSLARTAVDSRYVRPEVNDTGVINIKGGKHPVVSENLGGGLFVPNDHYLDLDSTQIVILTGPNMAGKSTYLRQLALIVLMAQIGSFVPAESASIGIVDRIFTRVGASDDLATGQSTFMVEMTETANIVHNATRQSLIVIDELGRGTSTYDGMALTQAVTEYIHDRIGAKTVISTHFHELTRLADDLNRVANYRTEVREMNREISFLYRVVPGGADKSYGVNVARMAGLPASIIVRAEHLLARFEGSSSANLQQMELWDLMTAETAAASFGQEETEVLEELKSLDINAMTPIEALNKLYELREKMNSAYPTHRE